MHFRERCAAARDAFPVKAPVADSSRSGRTAAGATQTPASAEAGQALIGPHGEFTGQRHAGGLRVVDRAAVPSPAADIRPAPAEPKTAPPRTDSGAAP